MRTPYRSVKGTNSSSKTGGDIKGFCYLVVGGGASGSSYDKGNGGGGGGAAICGKDFFSPKAVMMDIKIGQGGEAACGSGNFGNDGCPSSIEYGDVIITANGGCKSTDGFTGGNSGGGYVGGAGNSNICCGGGGGGGSRGDGCSLPGFGCAGGDGGLGITYCGMDFGGGGGGAGASCTSTTAAIPGMGCCGGGQGGANVIGYNQGGNPATGCGGGGGGSTFCEIPSGKGGDGAVLISYPTDGSWGISNGVGGCKFTYDDFTVHCFTSDAIFLPQEPKQPIFKYLIVGGGGKGSYSGGGGGAVCVGSFTTPIGSLPITVGRGGASDDEPDGGSSCFLGIVANGGKAGCTEIGGASGTGCEGGQGVCRPRFDGGSGGGGGSSGKGCPNGNVGRGGNGGPGKLGYGGGGGGGGCSNSAGQGLDGGGNGGLKRNAGENATNCGGGGGGGGCGSGVGGNGAGGVVDVCYKADGSWCIHNATGGDCCYVCGDMCVHRFTNDGIFTITN